MKRTLLTILLALAFLMPATASWYTQDNTLFTFKAGVQEPSFMFFPYGDPSFLQGNDEMHLKLGFVAGISYQGFATSRLAVGGGLSYMANFNSVDTSKLLINVPIYARATWLPVQTGRFDLGISLSLGMDYLRYGSSKYLAPLAEACINPVFFFSESWGIGLEGGIMANAELYTKGNSKHQDTALTAFLPLTLTVVYRH